MGVAVLLDMNVAPSAKSPGGADSEWCTLYHVRDRKIGPELTWMTVIAKRRTDRAREYSDSWVGWRIWHGFPRGARWHAGRSRRREADHCCKPLPGRRPPPYVRHHRGPINCGWPVGSRLGWPA